MRRKAWSRTVAGRVSGGLEKLKQAATVPSPRNKTAIRVGTIVGGVAAAFALGQLNSMEAGPMKWNLASANAAGSLKFIFPRLFS